jgi:tRNA-splicing ligase RtcB
VSFKFAVQKTGPNTYLLPQVGQMRVPALAFLSDELYDASEEGMWNQVASGASHEGVLSAHLMPDSHLGFGVPVGSVLVTDGTLIQAGSGYDISCGVLYLRVPGLSPEDVRDWGVRERWIREVEKRVATGVGSARPDQMKGYSSKKLLEVFHFGAKALGIRSDLCERQYIPVPKEFDPTLIEKAYARSMPQLGSLGGGNHFIELQVGTDGSVWVMIHTGSRGYGHQTAEHFYYEGAKVRGLPPNRREESWLRLTEEVGQNYWAHHNSAANYAIANRYAIALSIQETLQEVFKVEGDYFYDISHNLIQEETIVHPDGTTTKGYVHRKGATRAFPAGHPDLMGTRWETTGHPVLIPGSMFDGAAILFPQEGAYKSACSVNHGSGRLLGRGAANRKLKPEQDRIDSDMRNVERTFAGTTITGIVSNQEHIPLDECREVYKNLDVVLEVLVQENIAKIDRRMYPVANVKGCD